MDTENLYSGIERQDKLLDSSALTKYVLKESNWASVEQYLVGCNSIELALKEVGNALWRNIAKKEIDIETAKKTLRSLSKIIWILDQRQHLERGLEIASKYGVSVYDSLFLSCAESNGLTLVSCDGKQLAIARELNIRTIDVR